MKFLGSSTYAGWKRGTRKSTPMLNEEFIKAMDRFEKLFEEVQNEKLQVIEKGGIDLRDKDKQVQKAKKQAKKGNTIGMQVVFVKF